jgi:hypothetical protein
MFQKALMHIDNVSNPSVWMQVGKMYDLIKNNKVRPHPLPSLRASVRGCGLVSHGGWPRQAAEDAYKQVIQLDPKPEMKAEALFRWDTSVAWAAETDWVGACVRVGDGTHVIGGG